MVETKQAPKKAKAAGAGKGANAIDPRLVLYTARAVSGLGKKEWSALGKEGRKDHMEVAKRVVRAQKRFAALSEKKAAAAAEA